MNGVDPCRVSGVVRFTRHRHFLSFFLFDLYLLFHFISFHFMLSFFNGEGNTPERVWLPKMLRAAQQVSFRVEYENAMGWATLGLFHFVAFLTCCGGNSHHLGLWRPSASDAWLTNGKP